MAIDQVKIDGVCDLLDTTTDIAKAAKALEGLNRFELVTVCKRFGITALNVNNDGMRLAILKNTVSLKYKAAREESSKEHEVYFRATAKYPFNLTEDQMREAVTLWDAKVKKEIVEQLNKEMDPFDITDDAFMLEVVMLAVGKALTAGMNMVVDKAEVIGYYLDQKKATPQVTDYDFSERMGVSGVLFPDGTFWKCGNAEHYILTQGMTFEEQGECVYFSSRLESDDSGVVSLSSFGRKHITNEQEAWSEKHLHYMDLSQVNMYFRLLREAP
jgi:hypothetical protein